MRKLRRGARIVNRGRTGGVSQRDALSPREDESRPLAGVPAGMRPGNALRRRAARAYSR